MAEHREIPTVRSLVGRMGGDRGDEKTERAGVTEAKSILRREPGCLRPAFDALLWSKLSELGRYPEEIQRLLG